MYKIFVHFAFAAFFAETAFAQALSCLPGCFEPMANVTDDDDDDDWTTKCALLDERLACPQCPDYKWQAPGDGDIRSPCPAF